ncbi:hypothetical protein BRYFOR_06110 [Marvinbryantia formatexigens DSM 14469]|uniref:DUF1540 domain-containing protein n=1 Tax=Marvinbryantia formatexigens DSM 14469 TaxID=478749 RepID=C6LBW5_9FIRM|nr:DUF1540 domain-containing protein [Marvinbryantia formatexigens]EET61918.1 hypothetical protein BRYFOR_06110 [Marvinbryantia formatexigens DSM 14469]UWO25738.1 DUF1540 domain-containing protein [Marvinbryantia formatexigens DSM 14469]SDF35069.1 protein of unknown function [Marvinbryantia formatexigens]
MPFLSCSAVKCIYNEDNYCRKGDILVEGNQAQEACETCCSSFREDEGGMTAKNSAGEPSGKIQVDCTACNCRYNENEKCQAGQIAIAGSSACQCRQTECSTFSKE